MGRDWTGNKATTFVTLAASNHSAGERQQHDYYATEPKAMELLLAEEVFAPVIWECACGEGHLSKVLAAHGYEVISTDLLYRGFDDPEPLDFLKETLEDFEGDIITNPPYKYAVEFVQQALNSVRPGGKEFFLHNPPKTVYVSASRLVCALNGEFKDNLPRAVAYAWYVWEKGYTGDTVIKWIN